MVEEKYISGTFWYYYINLSVRYEIHMKDEVDGLLLQKALDLTMTRFPYLKKRLVQSTKKYHIVQNDLPVVVLNTYKPVHLCDQETNYHLFAVSFYDNVIYFDNSHALFDGRGRGPVLHTLMYYYCSMRYNEVVEMKGVCLPGSEIDPREYEDPFDKELAPLPDTYEAVKKVVMQEPMPEIMFLPDMGLVKPSTTQIHHLRVSEKQLMDLCKSSDATPNTIITLLMCRAIAKLHPDSDKAITAGVYCDLRKVTDCNLTHKPIVAAPLLLYSKDMWNLDFAEQNTIMRGQLMLAADEYHLLDLAHEQKQWSLETSALPTAKQKIQASHKYWEDTVKGRTFAISYSGRSDFGTYGSHFKAFFPQVSADIMGLLLEVTTADGWFYVTFIQEWKEDVYFNGFLKQLVEQNIDFDLLYSSAEERAIFPILK